MLSLDIRTLSFLSMVGSLLLALGLLLVNRIIARDQSLRLWALGASVAAAGYVLLALRGMVPDLFSIVVGNTLLVAGMYWLYRGNRNFRGLAIASRWYWVLIAATAAVLYFFTYEMPNLSARIVALSAATSVVLFPSAWVLLRAGDKRDRLVRWFVAAAFLTSALFMGARAVLTLFMALPGQDFMAVGSPIHALSIALGVVMSVVLGVGLPLLVTGRMQAQLAESERRYSALFEGAKAVMLLVDPETGGIIGANFAARRFYGYDQARMLQMKIADINMLAPDEIRAEMQRAKDEQRDCFFFPHRLASGELRQVEVHSGPFRYDGRTVLYSIIHDVTERKRAETEVRTLSRAVTQCPASIVITDRAGNIEYVNPSFERATGYTRAEALGKNPRILKSARTPAETYVDLWRTIAAGGEWRGELCNRRKSGEQFWEHAIISGLKDETGNVSHYIAVKEDITERKHSEQALRESERNLREAQAVARIGSYVFDIPRDAWRSSPVMDEIFGIGPDFPRTLEGWTQILHPSEREPTTAHFRKIVAERRPFDREYRIVRVNDGAERWVLGQGRVEYGANGEALRMAGIIQDITERKRLEEVHLQAQKLESLGTLAGGVAHDFNNILAAIQGNADLAAQDVGPDHAAAESLEEIRRASARASELIRRITTFARPVEARQDVVDLGAVVSEVLKLLRSTIPAGISLRTEFAHDTPQVLADAGQIHEAIVNLTTNAAYAIGPRAGSIEYRLEPAQIDEQLARSISGLKEGRYARLTLTDSGCGMAPATLERIFDAFYTTKPVGEGTGLGLSMVHGIMKSQGGAVTAESTPAKGSRFALYFPAAGEKALKPEESAPVQRLRSAGQRLLYVDDEEALVSLASRALTRQGHSVSGFADPEQALDAFRARPQDFDAVVTDLSMPHMSGFELAREVLALRPEIPVLMTTGNIRAEDENKAREAGIRELILKPVTMEELSQVLDQMVRDSRARD